MKNKYHSSQYFGQKKVLNQIGSELNFKQVINACVQVSKSFSGHPFKGYKLRPSLSGYGRYGVEILLKT